MYSVRTLHSEVVVDRLQGNFGRVYIEYVHSNHPPGLIEPLQRAFWQEKWKQEWQKTRAPGWISLPRKS